MRHAKGCMSHEYAHAFASADHSAWQPQSHLLSAPSPPHDAAIELLGDVTHTAIQLHSCMHATWAFATGAMSLVLTSSSPALASTAHQIVLTSTF